jgi:hypothetical protein
VFSLLFTPLGRYLLIGGIIVVVIGGAYLKIRADAVAEIEAAATADALRRTNDAIRAGDLVPVSPDRLRERDRNERD